MIKTVICAAIVSVAFAAGPASAPVTGGDSESLAKVGGTLEGMADGPIKSAASVEVAAVNQAISKGDMHACAIHIQKADHIETSKPAS